MIPETYLIIDTGDTIREAQVGLSRQSVIDDIFGLEIEAKRVLRLGEGGCSDVTTEIADAVLRKMEKSDRPAFLIPSLVEGIYPDRSEALSRSWMSAAERKADRAECDADRLREDRAERRMLEAAE